MMASMDRAGRVVIPKELRDRLGIEPEAPLTIEIDGDTLVLTPARLPRRVVVEVDGWPVLQPVTGYVVSDSDVQRWRDADQR